MSLDISHKGIKSLEDYFQQNPCPENITILYCYSNQLTSLKGCPPNITILDCSNNQLTSLCSCPTNLTKLWCYNNPLSIEYKDKTLEQIYIINFKKKFSSNNVFFNSSQSQNMEKSITLFVLLI